MTITPTERSIRSTVMWLKAMQREHGTDVGMKCFDTMRAVFGEDMVGAVTFGLMDGFRGGDTVTIRGSAHAKIEAIKLVRTLSGCGLKEAKDAVEAAEWRDVDFTILPSYCDPGNYNVLERYLQELERTGVAVR